MKRIHAIIIALALAVAVVAGTFAAMRSAQLGAASSATPRVTSSEVARQTRALNRAEAALRAQLRRRPPAVPGAAGPSGRRADGHLPPCAAPSSTSSTGTAGTTAPSTATAAVSMTSAVARLYVVVATVTTFFLVWAAVAAHPWATASRPAVDPRIACDRRPPAAPAHRVDQGQAHRRCTLGALPHAAGRSQPRRCERVGRRAQGAGRQPAGARRDEDLMMHTRSFRAMGTTVELVLESDSAEGAFDAAEAEFERLEQVMSRFRESSELSRLNDDGSIDASVDLAAVVELALAARERHRRPLRPDRPRRPGGGRVRPQLRRPARRRPRHGRPRDLRGCGERRGPTHPSSRRACASTSAGSARALPPSGSPSSSRAPAPAS